MYLWSKPLGFLKALCLARKAFWAFNKETYNSNIVIFTLKTHFLLVTLCSWYLHWTHFDFKVFSWIKLRMRKFYFKNHKVLVLSSKFGLILFMILWVKNSDRVLRVLLVWNTRDAFTWEKIISPISLLINGSINGAIAPLILVELELDSDFWIYKDPLNPYWSPEPIVIRLHI